MLGVFLDSLKRLYLRHFCPFCTIWLLLYVLCNANNLCREGISDQLCFIVETLSSAQHAGLFKERKETQLAQKTRLLK